jgi:phosphoglycolate phosphatase-like HAD superfamily hydrolase
VAFELSIFDYDGVLVDSLQQVLSLSAAFCRSLGHGRAPDRNLIEALDVMTYPELARAAGIPPRHVDTFTRYMFDGFRSASTAVAFFPGIPSLLRQLPPGSAAIVSGNAKDTIAEKLAAVGLASRIAHIFGALEAGDKAEKIQSVCIKAGVGTAQACMVGDAVSDIRASKRAGVTSVAVTWGWQPGRTLAKESPDHMVDSVSELTRLLLV